MVPRLTNCCRRGGLGVIFSDTFVTHQVVQCCHWTMQCPLLPAQWPLHYLTPFSCPVCPIVQLLLTQSRLGLFNAHSRANMSCHCIDDTQGSGHQWEGRTFVQPLHCSLSALVTVQVQAQTIPYPCLLIGALPSLAFVTNEGA